MPLFSIIVPVYKTPQHLLTKCIDSITAQTFPQWECILVDDGSPDECGTLCDNYASQDSRITVVHKKNQGVSLARNDALALANGSYITFVDADDTIEATLLQDLAETIEANSTPDLILFLFDRVNEMGEPLDSRPIAPNELPSNQEASRRIASGTEFAEGTPGLRYQICAAKAWRLEFLNQNEIRFPANISFREDNIFALQALAHDPKVALLDSVAYHWTVNSSSASYAYRDVSASYGATLEAFRCAIRSSFQGSEQLALMSATSSMGARLLNEGMRVSILHPKANLSFREATKRLEELNSSLCYPLEASARPQYYGVKERILLPLIAKRHYSLAVFTAKLLQKLKS